MAVRVASFPASAWRLCSRQVFARLHGQVCVCTFVPAATFHRSDAIITWTVACTITFRCGEAVGSTRCVTWRWCSCDSKSMD